MKRVKVFPTFANGSGCSFANESARKLGYIYLANHSALKFAKKVQKNREITFRRKKMCQKSAILRNICLSQRIKSTFLNGEAPKGSPAE